jgi:uncharacterized membrane protein YfcA
MLDAAVAFLAAILAGMGVGSGGIMVVWLTLVRSASQLDAQLLNLIFFVSSSVAALFINLVRRRLEARVVLPLALGGAVFSVGCALIARDLDPAFLRRAFGLLMMALSVISAVAVLKMLKNSNK